MFFLSIFCCEGHQRNTTKTSSFGTGRSLILERINESARHESQLLSVQTTQDEENGTRLSVGKFCYEADNKKEEKVKRDIELEHSEPSLPGHLSITI